MRQSRRIANVVESKKELKKVEVAKKVDKTKKKSSAKKTNTTTAAGPVANTDSVSVGITILKNKKSGKIEGVDAAKSTTTVKRGRVG